MDKAVRWHREFNKSWEASLGFRIPVHALSARAQGWLILQSRRGVSKSQIAHTVTAMVILNRRGGGARCAGRRLTYV